MSMKTETSIIEKNAHWKLLITFPKNQCRSLISSDQIKSIRSTVKGSLSAFDSHHHIFWLDGVLYNMCRGRATNQDQKMNEIALRHHEQSSTDWAVMPERESTERSWRKEHCAQASSQRHTQMKHSPGCSACPNSSVCAKSRSRVFFTKFQEATIMWVSDSCDSDTSLPDTSSEQAGRGLHATTDIKSTASARLIRSQLTGKMQTPCDAI